MEDLTPTKQDAAAYPGQFSYHPLSSAVPLDHIVQATEEDGGTYVTIFGLKDTTVKNFRLKAKANYVMENMNLEKERIVAVQVCDANQAFQPLDTDPNVVIISSSKYLDLLGFIDKEWPRVCKKLSSDCASCAKLEIGVRANSESHVYLRGNGTAVHTMVLGHTARGDTLQFKTHCFMSESSPNLWCSLGYNSISLGTVNISSHSLVVMSRDLELLKDFILCKGQRATLQIGGSGNNDAIAHSSSANSHASHGSNNTGLPSIDLFTALDFNSLFSSITPISPLKNGGAAAATQGHNGSGGNGGTGGNRKRGSANNSSSIGSGSGNGSSNGGSGGRSQAAAAAGGKLNRSSIK